MQFLSRGAATRVCTLTDTHAFKTTPTYSYPVFERRLNAYADALGQTKERNTKLHVFLLGDILDGANIYPTQAFHQSEGDVRAQASDASKTLADWVERLRADWQGVEVWAVPGNHGRTNGKYGHESANWDLVCYEMMALRLGDRATVHYYKSAPTEHIFFQRPRIQGHNYLLYHGMGVKCYQGIPWYGIKQKALSWHASTLGPFDALFMGHFHTSGYQRVNEIEVYLSGSFATSDEWALEALGSVGDSHSWTFAVTDKEAVVNPTRLGVG